MVGIMTAVAKTITAYKPHLHSLFVRKMRRRNKHIDNLVQSPEKMPMGSVIELHFEAIVTSWIASAFVE